MGPLLSLLAQQGRSAQEPHQVPCAPSPRAGHLPASRGDNSQHLPSISCFPPHQVFTTYPAGCLCHSHWTNGQRLANVHPGEGRGGAQWGPHPLGPAHAWVSLLCHLSAFLLTNPGLVRERCAGLGPAPCRSSLGCARGKIWRTPTNTSGWQPPLQFQSSRGGRETSQLPGEGRPACFRCTPSQVHPLSGAPLSGAPSRFSGERGACFPLEQSLSVVTASCSV